MSILQLREVTFMRPLPWIVASLLPLAALAGCASGGSPDAGGGGRVDSGPGGFDAGPGGFDAGPGGFDAGPGGFDAGPIGLIDSGADASVGLIDSGFDAGGSSGMGLGLTAGFSMTISGDSSGGPTFERPLATTCPASSSSAVGTAVPYDDHLIYNASAGTLSVTVSTTASYDGYLVIYAGTTVPADTLMCLAGDDDDGPGSDPTVTFMLAPGMQALVLVTGFDNMDFGPYTMMISAS